MIYHEKRLSPMKNDYKNYDFVNKDYKLYYDWKFKSIAWKQLQGMKCDYIDWISVNFDYLLVSIMVVHYKLSLQKKGNTTNYPWVGLKILSSLKADGWDVP